MDMESDRSDGDMGMPKISRATIIIHPPLADLLSKGDSRRKGRRKF